MLFGAVDTAAAPLMSTSSANISASTPIPAVSKPSKTSTSGSSRFSVRSKMTTRAQRHSYGDYIVDRTIGEGEFGKVKLAWLEGSNGTKKYYALKLIRNEKFRDVDDSQKTKVYREMNSLKLCNHPNVIKLRNLLRADDGVCIVLDYASGGDMFHYIYKHGKLDERSSQRYFAQLVSGVNYLHWKGLVHRDLKLENLLLDNNSNILISDFGFANSFRAENKIRLMKTSCGSPCYAAPEVVNSDQLYDGKKVDVWSVGVILFTFLAGYLPFDDDPNNPDSEDIQRLYRYIANTPLKFPDWIGKEPRDLMRKILVVDPEFRAKIQDIINHQWLAAHNAFLSITAAEHEGNAPWQQKSQRQPQQEPQQSHIQQSNGQHAQSKQRQRPVSAMPAPIADSQRSAQIALPRGSSHAGRSSLARSASLAAAAASQKNSTTSSRGDYQGNTQGITTPTRPSSIQQGSKPFEPSHYKRQSAYPAITTSAETYSNRRASRKDEVPDLAIAQPPQRLTQPTKPRPVSYHPQISQAGNSFELLGGSSLYAPLAGQPHVELNRESSKSGEMSRPSSLIVESEPRRSSSSFERQPRSAIPVSQIPRSSSVRSQRGAPYAPPQSIQLVKQSTGHSQSNIQPQAFYTPQGHTQVQGATTQTHFQTNPQVHGNSQLQTSGGVPQTPALQSSETSIFHDLQTPKAPEIVPPTRRSSVRTSGSHRINPDSTYSHSRRMSYHPASTLAQQQLMETDGSSDSTIDANSSLVTVNKNSINNSIPTANLDSIPQSRSRFRLSGALFQRKPSEKPSSASHNRNHSYAVSQTPSKPSAAASAAVAASKYQPSQYSGIPVLSNLNVRTLAQASNESVLEPESTLNKQKEPVSFKTRTMNFFKRRSMIG